MISSEEADKSRLMKLNTISQLQKSGRHAENHGAVMQHHETLIFEKWVNHFTYGVIISIDDEAWELKDRKMEWMMKTVFGVVLLIRAMMVCGPDGEAGN